MKNKLFISNIDFEVTSDQLQEMFSAVGSCVKVVIATDRETKKSKGFAFVDMAGEEDAAKAIKELDGKVISGRPLKVSPDRGKGDGAGAPAVRKGKGARGKVQRKEFLPPIQPTQIFQRRKKLDPFMEDPTKTVDWKDCATLSRFVSERGRILSRRMTGLSAYNQRKVKKAIKRAQSLGLMPYAR